MIVITGKGNGKFKKAHFEIDGDGPYVGWTDGSKSSGWDCPRFEKSEADKIMKDYNAHFNDKKCYATYDEENDTYIYPLFNGDELEEINKHKGHMINTSKGEIKVYTIGEGSDDESGWTWEEEE